MGHLWSGQVTLIAVAPPGSLSLTHNFRFILLFEILIFAFVLCIMGWFWSIGSFLYLQTKPGLRPDITLFRAPLVYATLYLLTALPLFLTVNDRHRFSIASARHGVLDIRVLFRREEPCFGQQKKECDLRRLRLVSSSFVGLILWCVDDSTADQSTLRRRGEKETDAQCLINGIIGRNRPVTEKRIS